MEGPLDDPSFQGQGQAVDSGSITLASVSPAYKVCDCMTHTVCQPCHDCKYTDCVAVCPVECFYQDDKMLYIDPVDCIDCEACVPECPVEAIFAEANVPAQWTSFTPLNAEKSAELKGGSGHITEKQDPQEGPECKKK
jgi:ferredoxin